MKAIAKLVWGCVFLLPLLSVSAAFSEEADPAAKEKELKKFAGKWQVVSLVIDGNTTEEDDAKKITVTNDPNGESTVYSEGKVILRALLRLDTFPQPKVIDMLLTEGQDTGKTMQGIYELGEETQKACYAGPNQARPTEFTAPSGSGNILVVLRRIPQEK